MKHVVTLIPGDGTGPEIIDATKRVLDASGANLEWEVMPAGKASLEKYGNVLPDETLESIRRNKVALKGPITTPVGTGFRSVNVAIRKNLDLYANVRTFKNLPNVPSRYEDVDIVMFREATEDLYAGIEHMVGDYAAESIKIITRKGSERIARRAFEYAQKNGRKRVTVGHKANIMKYSDGLFMKTFFEVAKDFPEINADDRIIDNLSMQLVQKPEEYEVIVLPNLYGDILSDLCAGLVGGLGVAPGANIGDEAAVFEPIHGSAPKYAGLNKVNPLATILSGLMMLEHIGEKEAYDRVYKAILDVLAEGKSLTYDLGGSAGTSDVADAIIDKMS
ncbi:MAG: isocitrate dehydrogenase [Clostridia bacterium]|nr:isocitrate dehydrogenase [Clostridia bacterium]